MSGTVLERYIIGREQGVMLLPVGERALPEQEKAVMMMCIGVVERWRESIATWSSLSCTAYVWQCRNDERPPLIDLS